MVEMPHLESQRSGSASRELIEAHVKIANLETALSTNRRIGVAVGILMALRKLPEQEAFELLRVTSQNANRKLRDIAEDVVRTGTLPAAPPQLKIVR